MQIFFSPMTEPQVNNRRNTLTTQKKKKLSASNVTTGRPGVVWDITIASILH